MQDDPSVRFQFECDQEIEKLGSDRALRGMTREWFAAANAQKYSYHFRFLGRPIIQYPQDMVAISEIIWSVQPDLIIETGIAHGGSLILSAAMLAQIDYAEAVNEGRVLDPRASNRRVIGVDIDIRVHNRSAIEQHHLAHKIHMIEGSSVDQAIIDQVYASAKGYERVLVILDSNHTHDHVMRELEAYAPLVTRGSYCVVFDTVIEDLPPASFSDRPWGIGNNPKTATREYLSRLVDGSQVGRDGQPLKFEVEKAIENKLLITVAPEGFLKRL